METTSSGSDSLNRPTTSPFRRFQNPRCVAQKCRETQVLQGRDLCLWMFYCKWPPFRGEVENVTSNHLGDQVGSRQGSFAKVEFSRQNTLKNVQVQLFFEAWNSAISPTFYPAWNSNWSVNGLNCPSSPYPSCCSFHETCKRALLFLGSTWQGGRPEISHRQTTTFSTQQLGEHEFLRFFVRNEKLDHQKVRVVLRTWSTVVDVQTPGSWDAVASKHGRSWMLRMPKK